MKKYPLDTNICAYFLNGKYNLGNTIEKIGLDNCAVSEITIAELKYGTEKSTFKGKNRKIIELFQNIYIDMYYYYYNCLSLLFI